MLKYKDIDSYVLTKPMLRHYKAMMEVDRDFLDAGEEAYCGVKSHASYALWLWSIWEQGREDALEYGANPNEIYLLMQEETVLACGQFRPIDTNDVLTWAGHIGYSVPPSLRGRGYAQAILQKLLGLAFERGLDQVLLTCDETNAASRHVIEKAGGEYEGNYTEYGYNKRRYWFYRQA